MKIKALTKEEILERAPAVLSEKVHERTSDKYVHIPTVRLIEDMKKLGWIVVAVTQPNTRKEDAETVKHMVTFQHPDLKIEAKNGDTVLPQVLVTNAHNGYSAFRFHAGIFRMACSNGMVIPDKNFDEINSGMAIRHKGYSFEAVQERVKEVLEAMPETLNYMNKFNKKIMKREEMEDLAKKALEIRFGEAYEGATFPIDEILKATRSEDKGNHLWKVFNRIQEQMVTGTFSYVAASGRNKTARPLKNFTRDLKVNKELFALAQSYVAN